MFELFNSSEYENSVIITIGLLIPKEQSKYAVDISKEISRKESCSFILDDKGNPPRVRLYESVFPVSEVDNVTRAVEKLTKEMISFPMQWSTLEVTEKFVAVWGIVNDALRLFHEAVLEQISPLRHGYYKQKYLSEDSEFDNLERESFRKWGSPWAEPYEPHMIISKAKKSFSNPPFDTFWPFNNCYLSGLLVEVKENKRIISVKEFNFPGEDKNNAG